MHLLYFPFAFSEELVSNLGLEGNLYNCLGEIAPLWPKTTKSIYGGSLPQLDFTPFSEEIIFTFSTYLLLLNYALFPLCGNLTIFCHSETIWEGLHFNFWEFLPIIRVEFFWIAASKNVKVINHFWSLEKRPKLISRKC